MRTLVKYCLTGHLVLLSYVLLCSCCVFMDSCFTHVQHVHNYCILFVQRVDRERELIIAVSLPLSRTSVWLWSNSVLCKKKKKRFRVCQLCQIWLRTCASHLCYVSNQGFFGESAVWKYKFVQVSSFMIEFLIVLFLSPKSRTKKQTEVRSGLWPLSSILAAKWCYFPMRL